MSSPSTTALSNEQHCEQCGEPLIPSELVPGCLHCMLTNGITARPPDVSSSVERQTYQHYEILRCEDGSSWELGRNATSVTYKARDMNLDMIVALKVLNSDLSRQPEARARFLRQAQAMAQIRHPNVANVIQFGVVGESRLTVIDLLGPAFMRSNSWKGKL